MLFVSTGKDAGSIRFRKVLFPRGLCSAHLVFCHVQEFLACSFHTLIIGLRVTDKEDLFLVFQACFFFFKPQTEERTANAIGRFCPQL